VGSEKPEDLVWNREFWQGRLESNLVDEAVAALAQELQ